MKKKFLLLLIFILICLISISMAEDYIIHSGTKFGDTIDEVNEKETLRCIENGVEFYNTNYTFAWYGGGEVAGYEGASIYYYFDENGILFDVKYDMLSTSRMSIEEFNNSYNELYKALTRKYGLPIDKNNEIYMLIKGYISSHQLADIQSKNTRIRNLDMTSWIVKFDNYSVKIDLNTYDVFDNRNCYIEYYVFTDEELGNMKEEYDEKLQKQSDDL